MSLGVISGALVSCNQGMVPIPLQVLPTVMTTTQACPVARITDMIPFVNVPPFGACQSALNPVTLATGVSPAPCIPAIPAPWMPGAVTNLGMMIPFLTDNSQTLCAYAVGQISVTMPGQFTVSHG